MRWSSPLCDSFQTSENLPQLLKSSGFAYTHANRHGPGEGAFLHSSGKHPKALSAEEEKPETLKPIPVQATTILTGRGKLSAVLLPMTKRVLDSRL
ncbi:MAG: hypothetical protein LR011_03075 [Verrucomicrobia bacterium]|nr:hypothetical protein [Verrucomicrobiota bacterium]